MAALTNPNARIAAVVVALVVLQQTVMTRFEVFQVHPDVLLFGALVIAIAGGPRRGAAVGFAIGLLHDVFLVSSLGLSALAYALAAYVVGLLADESDDLPWTTAALCAIGTVIAFAVFVFVGRLIGDVSISSTRALLIVVVMAVLNALLAPWVVPALRKLWKQKELSW